MSRIITLLIAFFTVITMNADPKKKFDPEAYRAEQHKFIQNRAQFTTEEASKFFALYDELRTKERQIFTTRNVRHKCPDTDEECRQSIIRHDNYDIQLKKLQQQYHNRMLKVLPARKVLKAIIAAEDFDRNKFREMSNPSPNKDKRNE